MVFTSQIQLMRQQLMLMVRHIIIFKKEKKILNSRFKSIIIVKKNNIFFLCLCLLEPIQTGVELGSECVEHTRRHSTRSVIGKLIIIKFNYLITYLIMDLLKRT